MNPKNAENRFRHEESASVNEHGDGVCTVVQCNSVVTHAKYRQAKYLYFVSGPVSRNARIPVLDYATAKSCIREISFQRKRSPTVTRGHPNPNQALNPTPAVNHESESGAPDSASRSVVGSADEAVASSANFSAIVDSQCEARRTAWSRWQSFAENVFWNGCRPLELAKMLVSNGLFLLSCRDQFAVRVHLQTQVEHLVALPSNHDRLPAPQLLKVRCAFCKRVFEVPHSSTLSSGVSGESQAVKQNRRTSQCHTLFAIASYLRLQHEKRSPSCPMVVWTNSDDVRFDALPELQMQKCKSQLKEDSFYKTAIGGEIAASTVIKETECSQPEEGNATLSESAFAASDSRASECLRAPSTSYSDGVLICGDDLMQFGTKDECQLNDTVNQDSPSVVCCNTPVLYDFFPSEIYERIECEGQQFTNCSIVNRSDEETQDGYESLFERFASDEACYGPFITKESRLETFEANANVESERISLLDYLVIVEHEEAKRKTGEDGQRSTDRLSKLIELRKRIGDVDWQPKRRALYERLAEAGFFSLRRPEEQLNDVCVCFWCGLTIAGWHDQADAFVEHARHMDAVDSCAYLFYRRGRQFILDARVNYLSENARTWRLVLHDIPQLRCQTPSRLLRRLGYKFDTTGNNSTDETQVQVKQSERRPKTLSEVPYDPVQSFRTVVTFRVQEREIRARRDLRVVRNLVLICGAQPLTVALAMERRLRASWTDFTNIRQFLEASWDLDSRMRTVKVTDVQQFYQLINQSAVQERNTDVSMPASQQVISNVDRPAAPNATGDFDSVLNGGKPDTFDEYQIDVAESQIANGEKRCVMCRVRPASLVIVPCGEIVLCADCLSLRRPQRCPQCDGPVHWTLKVYM